MDVKTIILGFLMDNSMTGYELKKAFSISFSFFSGISYGSIYPALKKMEGEGLITMIHQIADGFRTGRSTPPRKRGKALPRFPDGTYPPGAETGQLPHAPLLRAPESCRRHQEGQAPPGIRQKDSLGPGVGGT